MAKQEQSAVYNILAFTFKGTNTASDIFKQAKADRVFEGEKILAQAVVEHDAKGKIHVHEPGHGGVGAVIGGALGGGIEAVAGGAVAGEVAAVAGSAAAGLLGLMGGPVGLLVWVAAGALIGGVAGKYLGRPISKGDLEQIGKAMPPDTSAILVLVEDKESEGVVKGMKGYNAQVVTLTVGDELSGELAAFAAGVAQDDQGNVVAGMGGVAPDDEGNMVAGGAVAAGSMRDTSAAKPGDGGAAKAAKPADKGATKSS